MYSESRPGMRGGHQMCIDVHTGQSTQSSLMLSRGLMIEGLLSVMSLW